MDEGYYGLPTDELVPLAEKLLEVPRELIRTAPDLQLTESTVIAKSQDPPRRLLNRPQKVPPVPAAPVPHRLTSIMRKDATAERQSGLMSVQ
jgi:hypothetical protein